MVILALVIILLANNDNNDYYYPLHFQVLSNIQITFYRLQCLTGCLFPRHKRETEGH